MNEKITFTREQLDELESKCKKIGFLEALAKIREYLQDKYNHYQTNGEVVAAETINNELVHLHEIAVDI